MPAAYSKSLSVNPCGPGQKRSSLAVPEMPQARPVCLIAARPPSPPAPPPGTPSPARYPLKWPMISHIVDRDDISIVAAFGLTCQTSEGALSMSKPGMSIGAAASLLGNDAENFHSVFRCNCSTVATVRCMQQSLN